MWAIWTNQLLPKALKSCPKSNKAPNLVTLTLQGSNLFFVCSHLSKFTVNGVFGKLPTQIGIQIRLLLRPPEFKLRWCLQFSLKFAFENNENKQKEARIGPLKDV